jgi:hypothetical protein
MLSEVNDPEKFRQCCMTTPDHCTRRYIGEFLQGKGVVFTEYTQGAKAGGNAVDPGSGVDGEVAFSHGKNWRRGIEFPNPVYFAFKINQTPYGEVKQCADWMSRVPQSEKGQYFVGISTPHKDENKARRDAQGKASEEAMRAGFMNYDSGPVQIVPEDWCMETSYQGGITMYKAKVLVLFTKNANPDPAAEQTEPETAPPASTVPNNPEEASPSRVPTQPVPATKKTSAEHQADYLGLLNRIKSTSFDSDKVKEVEASLGFSLDCAQLSALLNEFKFDNDKVAVVKLLRTYVSDPRNALVLEQNFSFSSDKIEIRDLFR